MNKKWLQDYVAEIVYGGVDGIVTTFAIIAASAGASLSSTVIFVLGFANLIADGFSMGVSAYLAKRAEQDELAKNRRKLDKTLSDEDASAKEVKKYMSRYGLKGSVLTQAVERITNTKSTKKAFLQRHKSIADDPEKPLLVGLFTFTAFIVVGSLPIIIYAVDVAAGIEITNAFFVSSISALFAFGLVGYFRGKVTHSSKTRAIIETVLLGAIAAALAYGAGYFLDGLVN